MELNMFSLPRLLIVGTF